MRKLKFLRCNYCGAKVYPTHKPLRQNFWLTKEVPSSCPNCGKEINIEKKIQLEAFRFLLWFSWCMLVIVFIMIITATFQNL